jgi:DNA-3-methyladenine glycosylase
MPVLKRAFYDRPTLRVARDLIGCTLVHDLGGGDLRRGRIVETEAYTGRRDRASHAHRGLTPRNTPMFGPPGRAYVYLIYGVHHCLNLVTREEGYPAAVLIRALEPLFDLDRPCHGPGRLTVALGLDLRHNGLPVTRRPLFVQPRPAGRTRQRTVTTPRIGVDYAGDWAAKPWRFVDPDSAHLSVKLRRRGS